MAANYSVLVDVEFNKGDIQRKLNALVQGKTVKLTPELDEAAKSKVKSELDALVKESRKAKIEVEAQGLNETKDGLDGVKNSSDQAKQSMDDMQLSYQAANAIFRETKEILSDMFEQVVTFDDSLTELNISSLLWQHN